MEGYKTDAVIAGVPLEEMAGLRKTAREAAANSNITLTQRRFFIDGHTGHEYHHNEINILVKNPQSPPAADNEIIKLCRDQARAASCGRIRIYSIFELFGDNTMDQLMELPEEERIKHFRVVWYKPEWEPLKMFEYMEG